MFYGIKYNFLLISSELKFASIYNLGINGYNSYSYQNVKISLSHLCIFSGLCLLIRDFLQYTFILSGITLSPYRLSYRSFATILSQLKNLAFFELFLEK